MIDTNKIKVMDLSGDTILLDVRSVHHIVEPSDGTVALVILDDGTEIKVSVDKVQPLWDQWRGNIADPVTPS